MEDREDPDAGASEPTVGRAAEDVRALLLLLVDDAAAPGVLDGVAEAVREASGAVVVVGPGDAFAARGRAVRPAAEGGRLTAAAVWVVPAAGGFAIEGGVLRRASGGLEPLIRSAAAAFGERTAVVLAGFPLERAALREVEEAGGAVVVARADAGWREELTAALAEPGRDMSEADLRSVLDALDPTGSRGFAALKSGTVLRRVRRRMAASGVPHLPAYAARLAEDPAEAEALAGDLSIGVTRFFRDGELWRTLEAETIPQLVRAATGDIRLWVPGCSTGEEVYSYAMVLAEELERQRKDLRVQIFGTDVSADAIAAARAAVYPATLAADVSPERLRKHFMPLADGFRVAPHLRRATVFAVQNVLIHPPLARMDLVSCRNVLIYLRAEVQPSVLDRLHFALQPAGVLVLGLTEALGERSALFAPANRSVNVFRKAEDGRGAGRPKSTAPPPVQAATAPARGATPVLESVMTQALADGLLPPTVIVDRALQILFLHQGTADIVGGGAALSAEFSRLLAAGPSSTLAAAVGRTLQTGRPTTLEVAWGAGSRLWATVRRVRVAGISRAAITLEPFSEVGLGADEGSGGAHRSAAELEAELSAAQAHFQGTIEELESANEELNAIHEEVVSGNEELRRANERLEATGRELEDLNAQLSALNAELDGKNRRLQATNDDLVNLLASSEVAALFLDRALRLRRHTPRAAEVLGLSEGEVGATVEHLAELAADGALGADVTRVLAHLVPVEAKVRCRDGRWYIRRVLPYRTTDDRIEGVVVTLTDVTSLQLTTDRLSRRERQQAAIARLGQVATEAAGEVQRLLETTVVEVADGLDAPLCKVLRCDATRTRLDLLAGVGWHEGLVGRASVPTGVESQGGYTLHAREPVVVTDLPGERRFQGPALLTEHGVVSGVSVAIGPVHAPWGVLGVHARERREFSADDVNFVQAAANVIWATVERQRAARAAMIAAERLRLATSVRGLATFEWDVATDDTVWSDEHYRMFGYAVGSVPSTREMWRARVHPDDIDAAEAALEVALARREPFQFEYRIRPEPHITRWVEVRGHAVYDGEGRPTRMFGVVIDVHERRLAEERQTILLHELDHRVRNILANILALARQTSARAPSVADYVGSLTGRVNALARAHGLLSDSRWTGASLRALVEGELGSYRTAEGERIVLGGPEVFFRPEDAQLVAMAIHELANNAARHGVLRGSDGRLSVTWGLDAADGRTVLSIEWREVGLMPVAPPAREGFGLVVLTRLVPAQLEAEVEVTTPPEGLLCRIRVPRERIDVGPEPERAPAAAPRTAPASLAGVRVLIVEDSTLTAMDVEGALQAAGARVAGLAATLAQAEARTARRNFDVVLLDRNLGGLMTDDLARRLRADGVPFIFLTGYGEETLPFDLAGTPVLNKPFGSEALHRAVAVLLGL